MNNTTTPDCFCAKRDISGIALGNADGVRSLDWNRSILPSQPRTDKSK